MREFPSYARQVAAAAVATLTLVGLTSCRSDDRTASRDPLPTAVSGPRADVSAAADPVMVATGDMVCGTGTPAGTPCKHAQVAALVGQINPNVLAILGDNQYENGTLSDYNTYYGPTYGVYKSITYPSVGNHEYQTANAQGYYDYFNGVGVQAGRAGDRSKGYYSYDLGAWHIVVINSNCGAVGGCGAGSVQEQWLRADLAAHPAACTMAYWHHPRFSSGQHGDDATYQAIWQALYDNGADLVLNGHDHNYERFAPQGPNGAADATKGIVEFVVGTGGKEQRTLATIRANSVVRSTTSFGVLKLTLHPTSYDFQFVPIAGNTLADAGTLQCVGSTPANQSPTASITAPNAGGSFPQGTSVTFTGAGTDPEDGALSGASLVWTSDRDGQIGTGTTFSKSNLTVGTHDITLTATDSKGAKGTATRTITITPTGGGNQPPVANFTWNCAGLPTNQCQFDASSSTDDVGITKYAWNWGNGKSESRATPVVKNTWSSSGTYNVTLTVTDAGGLTNAITKAVAIGTAPPANQQPSASITAPTSGMSVVQGTNVSFTGSGTDPEDGTLGGASLVWTSNRDGQIGAGTSFSKSNLTVGTHTITLTAKDAQNATGSASISLTVTAPANQSPTASISAPASGTSVVQGTTVTFTGSGNDPEDGALGGSSLTWTSNRDGAIGTGTSFSTTALSVGTHTVTLKATDSKGATATATTTVTITAPSGGTTVARVVVYVVSGIGDPTWTMPVSGQAQFGLLAYDANGRQLSLNGRTITFTTSSASIATITNAGLLTAVAPGYFTVTGTVDGVAGSTGNMRVQ